MIRLDRKHDVLPDDLRRATMVMADAAFATRRKTIANSMKTYFSNPQSITGSFDQIHLWLSCRRILFLILVICCYRQVFLQMRVGNLWSKINLLRWARLICSYENPCSHDALFNIFHSRMIYLMMSHSRMFY